MTCASTDKWNGHEVRRLMPMSRYFTDRVYGNPNLVSLLKSGKGYDLDWDPPITVVRWNVVFEMDYPLYNNTLLIYDGVPMMIASSNRDHSYAWVYPNCEPVRGRNVPQSLIPEFGLERIPTRIRESQGQPWVYYSFKTVKSVNLRWKTQGPLVPISPAAKQSQVRMVSFPDMIQLLEGGEPIDATVFMAEGEPKVSTISPKEVHHLTRMILGYSRRNF